MMSLLTDLLMAKVPGFSSKSESAESIQSGVEFTQTFKNVLNGTLEESVNSDGSLQINEVPLSVGEHPLPINATAAPADSDAQGVADDFKASIHKTVSGAIMDSSIPTGTLAASVADSANQSSAGPSANATASDSIDWPGLESFDGMAIDPATLSTALSEADLIASASTTSNMPRRTEDPVVPLDPTVGLENGGSLIGSGPAPSNGGAIHSMKLPTGGSAADPMAFVGSAGNDAQVAEGVLSSRFSDSVTSRASFNVAGQVVSDSLATNSVNQSSDASQTEALRVETASHLTLQASASSQSPLPTARPTGESGDRDALTMAMLTAGNSARAQGVQEASSNLKSASTLVQPAVSESVSLQTQTVGSDIPTGRMPSPEVATTRNAVTAPVEPTVGPVVTTAVTTSATVSSSPTVLVNDVAPREQQQFANDMATHVRVLKGQGGGEAKLNLHPMELGRMSITVATEGSETKVMFVVETAQARQSIEAAMPRLREMLEQAGLSLTDSDVAERKDQPQSGDSETWSSDGLAGVASTQDADIEAVQISVSMDPERLLDTFA